MSLTANRHHQTEKGAIEWVSLLFRPPLEPRDCKMAHSWCRWVWLLGRILNFWNYGSYPTDTVWCFSLHTEWVWHTAEILKGAHSGCANHHTNSVYNVSSLSKHNTVVSFHVMLSIISTSNCILASLGFRQSRSQHLCLAFPSVKPSSIASLLCIARTCFLFWN